MPHPRHRFNHDPRAYVPDGVARDTPTTPPPAPSASDRQAEPPAPPYVPPHDAPAGDGWAVTPDGRARIISDEAPQRLYGGLIIDRLGPRDFAELDLVCHELGAALADDMLSLPRSEAALVVFRAGLRALSQERNDAQQGVADIVGALKAAVGVR